MVSFTHEQNSICCEKQLNDIAHEHTILCRQLFVGHVVGSQPMKRKKHLHQIIITFSSGMYRGGIKLHKLFVQTGHQLSPVMSYKS